MSNCNCENVGCACIIQAGPGVSVTGSGSAGDPFVVSRSGGDLVLTTQDTPSLNLQSIGSGSDDDPYILSGVVTARLQDLSDVDDASGPGLGDVPVWTGSAFVFAPPPTVPPGAVNTIPGGLLGDGSFGDPLGVNVSEVVEDSTAGLGIYVDSLGQLRAVPPAATTVPWTSVTGKPSTFPPVVGSAPTSAKAGNWLPAFSEVGSGIAISATEPVGTPEDHIWLRPAT